MTVKFIVNPIKAIGSGISTGVIKAGSLAGRAVWALLFPARFVSAKIASLFHLAKKVIDPLAQKIFNGKGQKPKLRHEGIRAMLALESQRTGTVVIKPGKNQTLNLDGEEDFDDSKSSSLVFSNTGTFVVNEGANDPVDFADSGTCVVNDGDNSSISLDSEPAEKPVRPGPNQRKKKAKVPGIFDSIKKVDRDRIFWPTKTPLVRELLLLREGKGDLRDSQFSRISSKKKEWRQARKAVRPRATEWQGKLAGGVYQGCQAQSMYQQRQVQISDPIQVQLLPMTGGSGGAYWVKDLEDKPLYVLKVQAEAGGAVFARKYFDNRRHTFDPFLKDDFKDVPFNGLAKMKQKELAVFTLENFTARPNLPDQDGFVRASIPAYREAFSEFLAYELSERFYPNQNLVPGTTVHVIESPEFFDYKIDPNDLNQRLAPRARVCSVQQYVKALDFDQWILEQGSSQDQEEALDRLNPESVNRLAFLDLVIGMTDRHVGNMKVTEDEKLIGIDHGLAFPTRHKAYRFSLLQLEQTEHFLSDELKELAHRLSMEELEPLLRNWGHNDDRVIEATRERVELIQWCLKERPDMTLQEMGCRILLLKKGPEVARRDSVSINDPDISQFGIGRK